MPLRQSEGVEGEVRKFVITTLHEGYSPAVAYPGMLFGGGGGGGGLTNSVVNKRQTEWRQLLFGTRNLFSYSNIFLIFGTLRLFMMTTNLFVIANVKQMRT